MLARLELELNEQTGKKVHYNMSSTFHGFLMSHLDTIVTDHLHTQALRPYTQRLIYGKDNVKWILTALNDFSLEKILQPLMEDSFQTFSILDHEMKFQIRSRKMETSSISQLMKKYYFSEGQQYITIQFDTPSAFRSANRYVFYPDLRLIFQSWMQRFDAFSQDMKLLDEEVLQQLCDHTDIVQYRLHSTRFHLEKTKIPSFKGEITLKLNGPLQLVSLVNFLASYGEYSGTGIKTALGMGGIQWMNDNKK